VAAVETVTVPYDDLCQLGARALQHLGASPRAAGIAAETIVRSEAEGAVSHGMSRLPILIRRIRAGGIDATATAEVVRETASTAVLEGNNGIGQVLATDAMEAAIGKARETDLALVVVRNGSHLGRLGHFATIAAEAGMLGYAATNASPRIVPQAGASPVLGNNPWAMAVPTGGTPVVVDMANTVVAAGKIRAAKAEGEQIPADWATDADGNATTDPAAALGGALLGVGGHKGWALSLLVDAMTGVLAGGRTGDEVGPPDDLGNPQGSVHVFSAINIAAFRPEADYRASMDDLASRLRAKGGPDGRLPGQRSAGLLAKHRADGVPVRRSAVRAIDEALQEIGLDGWAP